VKYAWIEEHSDLFSVARMCRQLGVSRTGYCQWRTRPPSERSVANATLDAQVVAIHAGSKRSYGRPRIVLSLLKQGVQASHERVRNSMKRQHLRPVYKRPYRVTTDSAHQKPIAPNVLKRRFDGWRVNEAWVADITYIATAEGCAVSGVRHGSGKPQNSGLVDERAHEGRPGMPSVEVGILEAQTARGTDHAFGPWQSVCGGEPSAVDQRPRNDPIDEQTRQLLGQCGDGELLQDPKGRARPSAAL
jgi:hypothetical protein